MLTQQQIFEDRSRKYYLCEFDNDRNRALNQAEHKLRAMKESLKEQFVSGDIFEEEDEYFQVIVYYSR